MRPLVVARRAEPFVAANDVTISPQTTMAQCSKPDIVCVPELMVPTSETLDGRFTAEIEWLRQCYAAGATLAG